MSDRIQTALALLADALPGAGLAFYTRAPVGDLRFTWTAGDLREVTGHPGRSFTGDPAFWQGVLHPGDRERTIAALKSLAADPDGDETSLRYRILDPRGRERWIRDDVRLLRSGDGTPAQLMGMLRDVSESRRQQSRISRLEERLWEAQRMESLGSLAGSIAHDFNNLLTAILSSAQLVEADPGLSEEARGDLGVIREAVRKGSAMVRQILEFSGRSGTSLGELDVGEVLREMEAILDRTVGIDVALDLEVEDGLSPVLADPARLEQVVLNLAVNAREAMTEGGRVRIRAREVRSDAPLELREGELPPGRYVCLTVLDEGPGIPPQVLERIFEPFFSTKRRPGGGGGSGVGLATVQRIVRGYGGAIDVESREGRGTAFHVYLPADRRAGHRGALPHLATRDQEGGGARILVVEHDPDLRESMEECLRAGGFVVVAVASAEEGLQVFDHVRPPFHLLVADVVLPDRPGPQLHRALRRRVPDLPVLFVSGYGEDVLEGPESGDPGVFVMAKPFTPDALQGRIRKILEAVGASAGSDPEVGAGSGGG